METLINCLCGRIAALRGTRNLDYTVDMSRLLRSGRLALHPAQTINQGFLRACRVLVTPDKPFLFIPLFSVFLLPCLPGRFQKYKLPQRLR